MPLAGSTHILIDHTYFKSKVFFLFMCHKSEC